MENTLIPVVDFKDYSLNIEKTNAKHESLEKLADDICRAFTGIGFVYLTNHGISQKKVLEVISKFDQFLSLPGDIKEKYTATPTGQGWIASDQEGLDPQAPADIKESYNTVPQLQHQLPSPDIDVPGFKNTMDNFFQVCNELVQRVLHVIGIGLNLQDPDYFRKLHNPYTRGNKSSLRALYYPPIDKDKVILPGQLRCGEHSDWGSVSLLFQDMAGGLQVKSRDGDFVAAKPIPGTVIVNIGDIMQRWTDDKLVSTVHRVVLPKDKSSRNSLAFFANPDDDCLVSCIDGCNKYKPVIFEDFIQIKIKESRMY